MKSIIGVFVLALFVVCLALPNLAFAGAEGASAAGSLKFVTGEMTFSDPRSDSDR